MIFLFTGAIGTGIYISYSYVDSIIGLQDPNISVSHSLAFLAIMVVFIIIGIALSIDYLLKAF